jgi:NAD(P)-dependent dehydrogenase (short-subunit alcohol dehydrogenase family)
MPELVALVTGGNRGLGFEVCRQLGGRGYRVVLGARNAQKGRQAAQILAGEGLPVSSEQLDVTDGESTARAVRDVIRECGRIDVLVNNAAILYDTFQRGVTADLSVVHQALETNLFGAWRLCEEAIPCMREQGYGRIVNVSSESGSLTNMGAGTPAYSVSKAALNALTRILAEELRGTGILVNAVCPGWVATDMGGAGGRPVADGAAGIVWAVTLPDDGPTAGFFRDGQQLPW